VANLKRPQRRAQFGDRLFIAARDGDGGEGAVLRMRSDLDDDAVGPADHRLRQPLEHEARRIIAQLRLEDLADAGQRHCRDHDHLVGDGSALRNAFPHEVTELFGLDLRTRLELDEGNRILAGVSIGTPDRGGDLDGRVLRARPLR